MALDNPDPRAPTRIRHELKPRFAEVVRTEKLSPAMVRVHLAGPDLKSFASPGFDDHVKLFFPGPGEAKPTMPTFGPNGPVFPEGRPRPVARDFTPRSFDAEAGTLAIDFALHEHGPATNWARHAVPGDILGIGGPRGSTVYSTSFDAQVLIGDETALPAIARRIEEWPADKPILALIEIDPGHEIDLPAHPGLTLHWAPRIGSGEGAGIVTLLDTMPPPAGDVLYWVATESSLAKALRARLIAAWNANPKWLKASGYWRRGEAGAHDKIE